MAIRTDRAESNVESYSRVSEWLNRRTIVCLSCIINSLKCSPGKQTKHTRCGQRVVCAMADEVHALTALKEL